MGHRVGRQDERVDGRGGRWGGRGGGQEEGAGGEGHEEGEEVGGEVGRNGEAAVENVREWGGITVPMHMYVCPHTLSLPYPHLPCLVSHMHVHTHTPELPCTPTN